MFEYLQNLLMSYSTKVPLEVFAFFASMIEEIVAPIPSPVVMIVTGSLAKIQGEAFYYLFILTLIGALGKTLGAIVVYFIADKIENLFSGLLEKFFKVTHADIESFGKKFTGSSRDYVIMFFMRALPIIPSSIVSIGSGIIKVPFKVFLASTFLGTLVRDFIYMYFGYAGISILGDLINRSETIESYIQLFVLIGVFAALVVVFLKRSNYLKSK